MLAMSVQALSTIVDLKLECTLESPQGIVRAQIMGPTPKVPDASCLGWAMNNKFPGYSADAARAGTTLREPLDERQDSSSFCPDSLVVRNWQL